MNNENDHRCMDIHLDCLRTTGGFPANYLGPNWNRPAVRMWPAGRKLPRSPLVENERIAMTNTKVVQ